jgi:hypothetical protein
MLMQLILGVDENPLLFIINFSAKFCNLKALIPFLDHISKPQHFGDATPIFEYLQEFSTYFSVLTAAFDMIWCCAWNNSSI